MINEELPARLVGQDQLRSASGSEQNERLQLLSQSDAEARTRRVELLISSWLRTGVIASLLFVVAGTVLSFVHHPDYLSSPTALPRLTELGAVFPHTLPDVVNSVRDLHGQAIVVVGLLLLIATPVMRVAVSIFAFIYQGNRVFMLITTVVLCLLLLSFALDKAV